MKVTELSRDQLVELKQNYLCHVLKNGQDVSYSEMAGNVSHISDQEIFDYYAGMEFSEDDFSSKKETLYCSECGGTNVQIMAWVDANTNKYCSDVNTPAKIEDTWCNDCEDHTGLATLPELWERFSEIPINNDDEIEEPFMCFPTGTYRFDVWHWFDERCPNNLHDDLMYPKTDNYE